MATTRRGRPTEVGAEASDGASDGASDEQLDRASDGAGPYTDPAAGPTPHADPPDPDITWPAEELSAAIPTVVKALGALAGSTTALTAILFYFGWSRAYYFYDYLGVDSSLLSLTTRDYIQLSVDGLFVPIVVAACGVLLLVWLHARLRTRRVSRARIRMLVLGVGGAGLLLMGNGLSRIVTQTPLNRYLLVAPLSLAVGACLLLLAMRTHQRVLAPSVTPPWVSVAEWGALVTLVGMSLFWMANDYSAEVGQARARQFVSELSFLPGARVYSAESLNLSAPGVQEVRCGGRDSRYRYRYDGLKLVLRSGDVYLLLPERWSRADGVAILLPSGDDIRLQFSPAGALGAPGQPC